MKKLYQWIIVRTDKGSELHNLIADELETIPEETGGNCKKAVINAARNIVDQMRPDNTAERKTGRKFPSGLEEPLPLS